MLTPPLALDACFLVMAGLASATPGLAFESAPQQIGGGWPVHYQHDGEKYYDMVGWSVAAIGDVDGDQVIDWLTGANYAEPGGLTEAGSAFLLSGASGQVLFRFDGQQAHAHFGSSAAAAGDVDADGIPDAIVGAPSALNTGGQPSGAAYVYSGADGRLLWLFEGRKAGDQFGAAICGVGDLDHDGHADLAIGAQGDDPSNLWNAGSVRIYSGRDGSVLAQWAGEYERDTFGMSLAGPGDLNRDGMPDLLVGAPGFASRTGAVYLYSGADGSLLHRFDGGAPDQDHGRTIASVGDFDGDGACEFLIGTPGGGPGSEGAARLYSGATQTLLHTFIGERSRSGFGVGLCAAGDVDADGFQDVMVGAPTAGPDYEGKAYLYSGRDGRLLRDFVGGRNSDSFGMTMAGIGDFDQDGYDNFVIGAPAADPNQEVDSGSAYVMGFSPYLVPSATTLSVGQGGTVFLRLAFPDEQAFHLYRVIYSLAGTGPTTLPGGLLVPLGLDAHLLNSFAGLTPAPARGFAGVLDAHGDGTAALVVQGALKASLVGKEVQFAAITSPWKGSWSTTSVAVPLRLEP